MDEEAISVLRQIASELRKIAKALAVIAAKR